MTAEFKLKLLSFLVFVVSFGTTPSAACFESERAALWDLKSGLNNPSYRLSSWTGHDCCSWAGVRCDNRTGRVVRLDLRNPISHWDVSEVNRRQYEYEFESMMLIGELNPSLVALTHLNYLDLSYNDFLGAPLPPFLASLGELRYLNLSSANFSGELNPSLVALTHLNYLDLSNNDFLGAPLPHFLASLGELRYLILSYSNFSGPIPLRFGNISGLRTLDLSGSYTFSGYNTTPLLQALGALDSLHTLSLSYCGLSSIPQSLPKGSFKSLTSLDLSYNHFNSTIPDWLFNITSLEYLYMDNSYFQGPIPPSIGMSTSLTFLDVSSNHEIIGPIPKQFGNLCSLRWLDLSQLNLSSKLVEFGDAFSGCIKNSLEHLDLFDSGLTGNLPDWMGDMKNLKHLLLPYNSINGSLPDSIGNLSSLQTLDIFSNSFYGSLPDRIRRLSSLVSLDLGGNSMTGVLSESHFANMSSLKSLDLSNNALVINVSQDWYPSFQLEYLALSSCRLGPRFPRWLRNQTNFHGIDFSNAGIEDAMPDWFWNWTSRLDLLDISHNQITGRLPKSLIFGSGSDLKIHLKSNLFRGSVPQFQFSSNVSRLEWLDLSNNSLPESIPPHIAGMKHSLKGLILSTNNFTGKIPSFVCELVELRDLDLSNNHLSGELPDCWNRSSYMLDIDVASNDLSGTIPSSIGLLPDLEAIHLSNNRFTGEIPSFLKNCTNLVTLDLAYNELAGSIPRWVGEWLPYLKILSLRSNKLTGEIPHQLAQLQFLQVLDLSHNNLSGGIPRSFGNFSAMKTVEISLRSSILESFGYNIQEYMLLFVKGRELRYDGLLSLLRMIDLSDNDLSGNIPLELFSLVGLHSLNLSKNHLSGAIHGSIGDLLQLEFLDLSRNRLSGTIPPSLAALAWLSFLNLSYNSLEGRIPTGNQLQTLTDPSIYAGNRDLCGFPLPQKCESSDHDRGFTSTIFAAPVGDDVDWKWALAGAAPGLAVGITIGWWVLLVHDEWRGALFRQVDRVYDYGAAHFGRSKPKYNTTHR